MAHVVAGPRATQGFPCGLAAAAAGVGAAATATPLGYERAPVLLAERMDAENCAVVHPLFGLDLAALCLS